MPVMMDVRKQVVTGVVPPQVDEALIRVAWPSVAAVPPVASLGRALTQLAARLANTIILLPLAVLVVLPAWLLMAPLYFLKILPFLATRYAVTNRRVMIQRGLNQAPSREVELSAIDDVRIQRDGNSEFFLAGTVEIVSNGSVVLTLPGVKEPETFRNAVLNACRAWAPGRIKTPFISAATSAGKK